MKFIKDKIKSFFRMRALRKEYATQDSCGTAYPFYVTVQEYQCVGVIEDDYSPNGCDAGIVMEHCCETCEHDPCYDEDDGGKEPEHCDQDLRVGYAWIPVEFFLTVKGAREYMRLNSHNHGKLRPYIKWFEYRNHEMRNLLKDVGIKADD